MSPSASRRLAWAAVGLAASFLVVHMLLGRMADTAFNSTTDTVLVAGLAFATFAFAIPGALIVVRQPRNTIGWLLLAIPLAATLAFFVGDYATYGIVTRPGSLPAARFAAWLDRWSVVPTLSMFIPLFLLFPDGRVPSRRWRPALWLAVAAPAVTTVAFAVTPGPMTGAFAYLSKVRVTNPLGLDPLKGVVNALTGIGGVATLVAAVLAAASLFFRFRSRRGDEREQVKWLAFVGIATFVQIAIAIVGGAATNDNSSIGNIMFPITFFTLILGIPGACAVAILKYRLYDIDVVINKTLVYGSLAAFITAVYVGVVVGIGSAFGRGDRPNLGLSILATAVVAVAFQPVRERMQRFANRLVYGRRAAPYEVLSHLASGMAGAMAADELLPTMARILAEGTGAARAEVWLSREGMLHRAAAWPKGRPEEAGPVSMGEVPAVPGAAQVASVRHQGQVLGALAVFKAPGDPLRPAEATLLSDLAFQAGVVLRNVSLIEDLRASRARLVATRDQERRKLERDIHDGAQQRLVALAVRLRLTQDLLLEDQEPDRLLLDDLRQQTAEALENLRELARGIYPPLLAEGGLVAALEAQARRAPLPVEVMAEGVGRYPQDTEAAVYFCCLEGVQNVAKYARANRCLIRLVGGDGHLAFSVEDDGAGFDPDATPKGSGLTNMADRLAVLGGEVEVRSKAGEGTIVTGRVPVLALEAVG